MTTATEKTPPLSAEQAADLAALTAAATADAPAAISDETPADQPLDQAREWAEVPKMIGTFVCMIAPELEPVYSEAACLKWGEKMVPCAEAMGWDAGAVANKWLSLAVVSGGFLVPTFAVIKAKRMMMQAAQHSAAAQHAVAVPIGEETPAPSSSKTVQFGTVQPE